jgi:subtilisin family serine protease
MQPFWQFYGTGRGQRVCLTFSLLAILSMLASCSLTNSPATPPPPATVAPITTPTAVAVRGAVPAGVPSSLPPVSGTPGSFTLPPNLPTPTGDQAKVDSILLDVAAIYQQQGRPAAEQAARDYGLLNDKNEVRLTLYLTDTNTAPVEAKIKELGGRVVASYDNTIDLVITLEALSVVAQSNPVAQLAAFSTVREIKVTPLLHDQSEAYQPISLAALQAQMAPIISEGVQASGAAQWQVAGYTGKGAKVAIVDSGFDGYQELLGKELPANVTTRSFTSDGTLTGSVHGTACAEIVHAMAPDAEIYLVAIEGPATYGAAFDYLISQGVKIISLSQGRGGETRGDGSGAWTKPVDAARAKGVLVVVASGNDGDGHYVGTYADTDHDGFHDFGPGKPFLKVGVGSTLDVALRWDAWTGTPVNLDLYVFTADGQLVASSRNVQGGSVQKDPVERILIPLRREFQGQTYLIAVNAVGATRPVKVEIFTKNSELELFTPVGSVATPGDAKGAFTVGATNVRNDTLETFSAQGPTADERVKPDLTGPDRVTTAAYTKKNPSEPSFPGTSAATPHVAGAAALVLGAQPNATPDQIQQFLISRVQDIEDPGVDDKSGAGDLRLGTPPGQQGTVPATSPTPRPSARPSANPSTAPATGAGRITVSPDSAASGTRFVFHGSGFPAKTSLPAVIVDSNNAPVVRGTVDVATDGTFATGYDSTGDPNGTYTLYIGNSAGDVLGSVSYIVDSGGKASALPSTRPSTAPSVAPPQAPTKVPSTNPPGNPSVNPTTGSPVLSASPNAAPAGTRFVISGAGFAPNTPLVGVLLDQEGTLLNAFDLTTSATGTLQVALNTSGAPTGGYSLVIATPDYQTALARASFTVR